MTQQPRGRRFLPALVVAAAGCGSSPLAPGPGGLEGATQTGESQAAGDIDLAGCTFDGATSRIVVARHDRPRDLCFIVVLSAPGAAPSGVTLPEGFGLESAGAGPGAPCPSRGPAPAAARTLTGGAVVSLSSASGAAGQPSRVSVDLTLAFDNPAAGATIAAGATGAAGLNQAAGSSGIQETLRAPDVDVRAACPAPACLQGVDQTCNDDPTIASIHGHCTDTGACVCGDGFPLNPATGRCQ